MRMMGVRCSNPTLATWRTNAPMEDIPTSEKKSTSKFLRRNEDRRQALEHGYQSIEEKQENSPAYMFAVY